MAPATGQGRDGFAVAALVLGIIPIMAGLLGIIFGIVALVRIRKSHRKGKGMAIAGIVLGSLWLAVITIAIIAGIAGEADRAPDGTVTSSGSVAATGLRVGDCPSSLPGDKVYTVNIVPCSQPHRGEVFSVFTLPGTDFPGQAQARRFAHGGCLERLPGFVGPARQDAYDLYYLIPTAETWSAGKREVQCVLTAPSGGLLPPGSAKAA